MSIYHVISCCLIMLLCQSCSNKAPQAESKGENSLYAKVYCYWDNINVDDLPEDSLEQFMVDYLYLLAHTNDIERKTLWQDFYKKIPEHPNRIVVDYLGNTDSPLYSYPLLEEYLVNILKHSDDYTTSMRCGYLLENFRKNSVGSTISNLKVVAREQDTTLRRLIQESGQSCMIIFYDPECSSCDAFFEQLRSQKPSELKIIAISVVGSANDIDNSWTSAFVLNDEEMNEKFYYSSLPSVYIVSKEGIVIERDIIL